MDISTVIFFGALLFFVLVVGAVILADSIADRRMMKNAMKDHTNPYIYYPLRKR